MSNHDIGLNIFLKRPKNRDEKYRYVYLRITIDGMVVEYSTQKIVVPEKWNAGEKKARGNSENAQSLNQYLGVLISRCRNIRMDLMERGKPISASIIKSILQGRDEDHVSLLGVFEDHNKRLSRQVIAGESSLATLQKYTIAIGHVRNFLKNRRGCSDILLRLLDYGFVEDYALWLREVRSCSGNTVAKYISNLRKIVFYAVRRGLLKADPFFGFKIKHIEILVIPLSMDELGRISKRTFNAARLSYVRDVFLFCCYTGLSYADVCALGPAHIFDGLDDSRWLHIKRIKTGVILRLPILNEAEKIIARYRRDKKCVSEGRLLPVFTNQKTNEYLKEIATLCGISRNITFHMARHTFATTITLANGVPIETVSKMLGHRSIRQTQHYAKILDQKVSEDMKKLRCKLSAG